ncbi:MAG TPA: PIG-L family deacetylase, partial [Accumulibacter sp.]|nr:PIG-L family deacetylase [Accumulibacter sp.]
MSSRKQQLLSRHRRRKRLLLALSALALTALGVGVGWGLPALLLLLGWVAHEAWFADHLFYSPQDDYQYRFPADAARQDVALDDGRLRLSAPLPPAETLILELELRSTWL